MKKYYYIALVVLVVLLGYYGVNAIFSKSYEIPKTQASVGEFLIALNENGQVDAKRAVTISTPRIRGLQITWLAEEGINVKEGDPVIKFDASKQIADLSENKSNLKIRRNTLERAEKEYTIQEKQLTLNLEKARRNYDEMKHEAPRVAEESKMEFELAELNFEAKLEQLRADVDKAKVEVERAEDKLSLAQRELEQMTLRASHPGLIVYLELWKGGQMGKVQEGDSPWPGQGLVNIPDLSDMMIKTTASEVDASQVNPGQEVVITVDAFPGKKYEGVVTKKSTLARKKEMNSKINVFDVEVDIITEDPELKPGMSASSQIVIERIPEVVSIPLEAVFERDGQTVVYMGNKKRRDVVVGRKNNMMIEITDGLEAGEEICLLDPTLDEPNLPGDRATEPELNKPKPPRKKGQGRGSKKGGR